MRIITGKVRGLKLTVPKDLAVRPTTDRVKESLFNIIGTKIIGAKVLDLFAGTGNLGLEAWSRGATSSTFIDTNSESLRLVTSNIAKARAEAATTIIKGNAEKIIATLHQQGHCFDFIFCDPPYNQGWLVKIINKLTNEDILVAGGYLVVEHSQHETVPLLPDTLELVRTEKYGETLISFLRRREE
ncbi:MAG: 16S rRNA (guanine(966)-N(2))-methyltransferase RsmD [Acidaminococcaceae bacterium]